MFDWMYNSSTGCIKSNNHCFPRRIYTSGSVGICKKKFAAKLFVTLKINVEVYFYINVLWSMKRKKKFRRNALFRRNNLLKFAQNLECAEPLSNQWLPFPLTRTRILSFSSLKKTKAKSGLRCVRVGGNRSKYENYTSGSVFL